MEYRFELRKGSKKDKCPNCGRKTFVPYLDKKTGNAAGEKYGRCERINECNYILYPKADKNDKWEAPEPKPYEPPKPTDYVDRELVEATFTAFQNNVFFMWLVEIFGREQAFELQAKYNIGTAANGGTIFWQQDRHGNFRTGKVIYYTPNGKRSKAQNGWFVHKKIREDFNFKQCFFGLHLVDGTKPVALCESEKTAVLMSVYNPEFIWIASGGSEMLAPGRLAELKRLDVVFADNGQAAKWRSKIDLHFPDVRFDISVDAAVCRGEIEVGSDIYDLVSLKK